MAVRADLPVAVIGAGPVGLAAATHLLERGLTPVVLERSGTAGGSVTHWRHVRLFSPWCMNVDAAAVRLLGAAGWHPPSPDDLPTGQDLLDRYLRPLSADSTLGAHVHLGSLVTAVTRAGSDKVRTLGRVDQSFVVRAVSAERGEHELLAQAVIDASGTWATPNPLGANGIPALGEGQAAHRIAGALPDVLGVDRGRFASQRVAVVGAGHSAATTLLALVALQDQEPATQITWVVRTTRPRPLVGEGDNDELPARGRLSIDVSRYVATGRIVLASGFRIHRIEHDNKRVTLLDLDSSRTLDVDIVINATGFRADHTLAGELRLDLDPALDSVAALGPLIDPNVHDCGSVPPHGARELAHPDAGYWIVGTKSYGRAPTFLLATGYEQVRSVVAAIAGDVRAALEVRPAGHCNSGVSGRSWDELGQ